MAILEDERPAVDLLVAALAAVDPAIEVCGVFDTATDALNWLSGDRTIDLLFADLRVADGMSIEVLRARPAPCPVVFVTAYDQHVIEALERGAIDYLLKPLDPSRLAAALAKYTLLASHFRDRAPAARSFVVRRGREHLAIPLDEIAWFATEHRLVFLVRRDGARFVVDQTLAEVSDSCGMIMFFRVNRSFIASRSAVKGWKSLGRGRLALVTDPPTGEPVVVPAENAAAFRDWLRGSS